MIIVKEVYKVARQQAIDFELKPVIEARKEAEQKLHDEVNKLGDLELIDAIAMMIPMVVAQLKEPAYFGELFAGASGLAHAEYFTRKGLPELADTMRLIQSVFGMNPDQKYLISIKHDPNVPCKFSVKKCMLLIDADNLAEQAKGNEALALDKVLETLKLPSGYSVSVLFNDELTYTDKIPNYDPRVISNLINTYFLTTLAVDNPKKFEGKINYKLSAAAGRSTYFPDEGEVLFELSQTNEVPSSWFDIFDKVELDDFDLKTELSDLINKNLVELTHKCLG